MRTALADAERAATLPFTEYPPTPWWFPPAVGAWSALMVLAVDSIDSAPAVFLPLLVALLALEGAFFAWYRRRSGMWPSLRQAPPEFVAPLRWYAVGVLAILAAIAVCWWASGPGLAAVVAFVLVTAGLWRYERAYASAADATRRRVS